jgi:hypothetical protein
MLKTGSPLAPRLATLLLWLFVVDLGTAFGAGLYESRVFLPTWHALDPRAWPNPGLSFWAFVTTGPLTVMCLAAGLVLFRAERFGLTPSRRRWWLRSLWIVLVERGLTFGYFIPGMLSLMQGALEPSALAITFDRWQLLNYLRHTFTLCAWLCSLAALSAKPH